MIKHHTFKTKNKSLKTTYFVYENMKLNMCTYTQYSVISHI